MQEQQRQRPAEHRGAMPQAQWRSCASSSSYSFHLLALARPYPEPEMVPAPRRQPRTGAAAASSLRVVGLPSMLS